MGYEDTSYADIFALTRQRRREKLFPTVRYNVPSLIEAKRLEDEARYELWRIAARKDAQEAKDNKHRSPGEAHILLATRLMKIQRGRCYLSGALFTSDDPPTWDHVTPRALGGRNGSNRLLSTLAANGAKGCRAPHPCEALYLSAAMLLLKVARKRRRGSK